jgi:hypothetical protein
MTKMHLDVYSPNFTSFKIKFEAVDGSNRDRSSTYKGHGILMTWI